MTELLQEFIQEEIGGQGVIDAVKELRWQFHHAKAEPKTPYSGKRVSGDAITYLLEHYRDDIITGRLTSGRLQQIDPRLFGSVDYELGRAEPKKTVSELLNEHATEHSGHQRLARRAEACATLLDTDALEASRFFGGLRGDRLSKWTSRTAARNFGRPHDQSRD